VIEWTNRRGKTTVAQAIAIAMNGAKDFVPGMITHGQEAAEIIAFTDNELNIRTVMGENVKRTVSQYDESLGRYVNVAGGVCAFLASICSGLEQPCGRSGTYRTRRRSSSLCPVPGREKR
jgi:hypothetical protein